VLNAAGPLSRLPLPDRRRRNGGRVALLSIRRARRCPWARSTVATQPRQASGLAPSTATAPRGTLSGDRRAGARWGPVAPSMSSSSPEERLAEAPWLARVRRQARRTVEPDTNLRARAARYPHVCPAPRLGWLPPALRRTASGSRIPSGLAGLIGLRAAQSWRVGLEIPPLAVGEGTWSERKAVRASRLSSFPWMISESSPRELLRRPYRGGRALARRRRHSMHMEMADAVVRDRLRERSRDRRGVQRVLAARVHRASGPTALIGFHLTEALAPTFDHASVRLWVVARREFGARGRYCGRSRAGTGGRGRAAPRPSLADADLTGDPPLVSFPPMSVNDMLMYARVGDFVNGSLRSHRDPHAPTDSDPLHAAGLERRGQSPRPPRLASSPDFWTQRGGVAPPHRGHGLAHPGVHRENLRKHTVGHPTSRGWSERTRSGTRCPRGGGLIFWNKEEDAPISRLDLRPPRGMVAPVQVD
jgi:hypothetical protein